MLSVSSLTITLHFTTPAHLPYWMGSAFRGVFGHEVRRCVCNNIGNDCGGCRSREDCLYYYLYAKPVSKRGHSPPQRPILLIPPFFGKEMRFEMDGRLDLRLLFFGDFRRYMPHAFLALRLSGQRGLASERHYGLNKFEIERAICDFSGKQVFDGYALDLTSLSGKDILDVAPLTGDRLRVGFRTPMVLSRFPPTPEELVTLIRNRLIRFVNEYGTQAAVPRANISGNVLESTAHFHILQRRSSRSNKREFRGYTGVVTYVLENADASARWLLGVGNLIGGGSDSSFGLGFLDIRQE